MNETKYKDDLREIKDIMSRSSRFISLSGLSGVVAGMAALAGVWVANENVLARNEYLDYHQVILSVTSIWKLLLIAFSTIILAVGGGIYLTILKARKNKQKYWDSQVRRMLINLFIPLVTGGILSLILLFKGFLGFVVPFTLIFYGLALVNASKYTLNEIRSLGIIQIILGLIATYVIGYGLMFWALGFGVMHIVYGIYMHLKYDR